MNYLLAELNQNTFLIYDCLESQVIDQVILSKMHQALIKEERDDILILLDGVKIEDQFCVKVLLLGLNGEFGEFCGNGSLCCAAYLYHKYPEVSQFKFTSSRGEIALNRHGDHHYSVVLPLPTLELNPTFVTDVSALSLFGNFTYVEMIEPHLVMHGTLTDEQLLKIGRELNARKELFPMGININVWSFVSEDSIYVKTYERGVQRLTKSCGTGSMSCVSSFGKEGTFKVFTPGGQTEVTLSKNNIYLKARLPSIF